MKHHLPYLIAAGAIGLATVAVPAQATTLDLNGRYIEFEDTDNDIAIINGTTMVSDQLLKDDFEMVVKRSGKSITLSNAYKDFSLTGAVGQKSYTIDGKGKSLSTAISEKDGKVFVPLRPILSLFGTVSWEGAFDTVVVRYDFNDYLKMPTATMADKPLTFERSKPLPAAPGDGWQAIGEENGNTLYQKWNTNNELTAIGTRDENIIKPMHKGYVLRGTTCKIEKDYLYWIEHPAETTTTLEKADWYLYMQERKANAEPIVIDHASFADLQNLDGGIYLLDDCESNNGNLMWRRGDATSKKIEMRLYQHATGKTQILDEIEFGNVYTTMEAALGEHDAIWTKLNLIGGRQQYGSMNRVDLATGKVTNFSKGYNLVNPLIVGDKLIIRNKPEGNNYLPDTENGGNISSELWVYDLKENKWQFKVTTDLPMLDKYAVFFGSKMIDESHVTLSVEGMDEDYDMPIVDLDRGTVYTAVDQNGDHLRYGPWSLVEGAVHTVIPLEKKGSALMKSFKKNSNNEAFYVRFNY
ncbi:MAG: stalk domain-containing protein [Peptococcaceae bacterium]|nr:stalk domain-containing protein [Peptococcaceae bacterium]